MPARFVAAVRSTWQRKVEQRWRIPPFLYSVPGHRPVCLAYLTGFKPIHPPSCNLFFERRPRKRLDSLHYLSWSNIAQVTTAILLANFTVRDLSGEKMLSIVCELKLNEKKNLWVKMLGCILFSHSRNTVDQCFVSGGHPWWFLGGHSIAPKSTSASPQPPNEKSRKRQSSYRLG